MRRPHVVLFGATAHGRQLASTSVVPLEAGVNHVPFVGPGQPVEEATAQSCSPDCCHLGLGIGFTGLAPLESRAGGKVAGLHAIRRWSCLFFIMETAATWLLGGQPIEAAEADTSGHPTELAPDGRVGLSSSSNA